MNISAISRLRKRIQMFDPSTLNDEQFMHHLIESELLNSCGFSKADSQDRIARIIDKFVDARKYWKYTNARLAKILVNYPGTFPLAFGTLNSYVGRGFRWKYFKVLAELKSTKEALLTPEVKEKFAVNKYSIS